MCWATYILLSAETGKRFERIDGLGFAMVAGALVALPFGISSGGAAAADAHGAARRSARSR